MSNLQQEQQHTETAENRPAAKKRFFAENKAVLVLLAMLVCVVTASAWQQARLKKANPDTVPDGVIRIGIFEPLSGVYREDAEAELRGIELAHQTYNRVQGKTVELVYSDNKSDLKAAKEAAEELIGRHVSVALGSYSNLLTLAASNTFRDASVPLINITGTNPLLTGSGNGLVRVATVDTDQAAAAAAFLQNECCVTKAAVLVPMGDDYAAELANIFTEAFEEPVETITYVPGSSGYAVEVAAYRSCRVQAVYLTGSVDDMALFVSALRRSGDWDTLCIGTSRIESDRFVELAGTYSKDVYVTGGYDPEREYTDETGRFLNLYRKAYGQDAVPGEKEALGYEAYLLAVDALKRAASSGSSLTEALCATENLNGVTGVCSVDESGNLSRTVTVWRIYQGKFVNAFAMPSEPTEETDELYDMLPEKKGNNENGNKRTD